MLLHVLDWHVDIRRIAVSEMEHIVAGVLRSIAKPSPSCYDDIPILLRFFEPVGDGPRLFSRFGSV